jgi:hypothetical protein
VIDLKTDLVSDCNFVGRTLWFTPSKQLLKYIEDCRLPYKPKKKRILRKWVKKYTRIFMMEAITKGIESYASSNKQV